MSDWYPVMLCLEGRHCVVVGGGSVASHKVASLLAAGAHVTLISPALHSDLQQLLEAGKIDVEQGAYSVGMLGELRPLLVFAATDDSEVNQQVSVEAQAIGALVDRVDAGAEGSFAGMSAVRRGHITIGIATDGVSPALAAHLRKRIESVIGKEYATLADWMAEARPEVRAAGGTQSERAALWRTVIESSVLDDLRHGDEAVARKEFDRLIEQATGDAS